MMLHADAALSHYYLLIRLPPGAPMIRFRCFATLAPSYLPPLLCRHHAADALPRRCLFTPDYALFSLMLFLLLSHYLCFDAAVSCRYLRLIRTFTDVFDYDFAISLIIDSPEGCWIR